MIDINSLLKIVAERGGSDLHICVGIPPRMRLHGHLEPVSAEIITPEIATDLMKQITPPGRQVDLSEKGSADFGYNFSNMARFRTSVFRTKGVGELSIVMRLIPSTFLSFEELGLPLSAVSDALEAPRGLVLVTGPTGSGKSTTLATMINWINENHDAHVITIEDPIEYRHFSKKSIINQREVGTDTRDFAYGVRGALRQDPDVILIGEMRDPETMDAAITAAETGHLVFATLHTMSAADTVNRIIDAFPVNQQEQVRVVLSTSLRTIIAQSLIPRSDGRGRVAAFEILHNVPAVKHLIRDRKVDHMRSVIQTSAKAGMMTMDDSLLNLYRRRLISGEECLMRAHDRTTLGQSLLSTIEG